MENLKLEMIDFIMKNKKIEETYMAEENRWTGYMKYESENTDNSETFIIYNFKNKKWNPSSKTYTLLNENKKNKNFF